MLSSRVSSPPRGQARVAAVPTLAHDVDGNTRLIPSSGPRVPRTQSSSHPRIMTTDPAHPEPTFRPRQAQVSPQLLAIVVPAIVLSLTLKIVRICSYSNFAQDNAGTTSGFFRTIA